MTEEMRLLGWHDPILPGKARADGTFDFRLRLSGVPTTAWRKAYDELNGNQVPTESLDRSVLLVTCALNQIEATVERVRGRLDFANQKIAQLEQEQSERAALHKQAEEDIHSQVLVATSRIRFDEKPKAGGD